TWRNKVIKVSLWIKRGHWHDFNWRQKAQLASSKEWQQKYDLQWQFDRHDSLLQTDIDWILSQLAAASNKTVLEIGPGTGKLSHRLNQAGYQVTTVDISQTVLQNLAVVGVTKIHARAEKLPFKDK